jgi:hypothetical protein
MSNMKWLGSAPPSLDPTLQQSDAIERTRDSPGGIPEIPACSTGIEVRAVAFAPSSDEKKRSPTQGLRCCYLPQFQALLASGASSVTSASGTTSAPAASSAR